MFNGIIFHKGKVCKISKRKKGINLFIKSSISLKKKDLGTSIACDGTCLTLTSSRNNIIGFYLSEETIKKTKFKSIEIGDEINLELPLKFGQNVSGHICQGHVDMVGKLYKIKKVDKSHVLEIKIPKKYIKYFVQKASILINGTSLTISKIKKNSFETWIIPHTYKMTNLSKLKKNSLVNIEIDILSKYVKKYLNEK